jgi:hypothetical protein
MSRATACFSEYSLMSIRTMARSSSKRNSASALASSVLPTPVGPRNRNEPVGRSGRRCRPASAAPRRRRARTAAACWPMRRLPSHSSMCSSFSVSPSSSRPRGCRSTRDHLGDVVGADLLLDHRLGLVARPRTAWASASCFSTAGISPYSSREACRESPSRCAFSAAPRSSSSLAFRSPTRLRPAFSLPAGLERRELLLGRSARSARSFASRSTEASSVSFESASSSIFSRSTWRLQLSISTGRSRSPCAAATPPRRSGRWPCRAAGGR